MTFWILGAIAVISTGLLTRSIGWPARPITGITTAISGVVTAIALALAARIIVVTNRGGGDMRLRSRPQHDSVVGADVAVSAEVDDDHAGKVL